jgi:hypothetical protein
MKRAALIIIIGLFQLSAYSQLIQNDTVMRANIYGKKIKFTVSNFGIQMSVGPTKYFYDNKTENYFGNHWDPHFKLAFYYKNIFLGFEFKPATVNPKDTLYFNTGNLFNEAKLNIIKTNIEIGYTINLPLNLAIEPFIGYLKTTFLVINESQINKNFNLKPCKGFTGGFIITKFIDFNSSGQYMIIYLNNNLNYSDYSNMNSYLGNYFYAIELGIGIKVWFGKKVKL